MPGPLLHSPADVLAQLLVAEGLGTDPSANGAWPVYVSGEPVRPDDCVTVYDTTGMDEGRDGVTFERAVHDGVQLRVRSRTPAEGFAKAHGIAVALDQLHLKSVTLESHHYLVNNVSRTGGVIPLGKDGSSSKRSLFTVNALVSLRQVN